VLTAFALFATPNAGADDPKNNDQMGIEDGGVAGNYSFGAGECGTNIDKADPVGVIFRGRRAGVSNVQGYLKTENHTDWDWEFLDEQFGKQALNVRTGSGTYTCHTTDGSNAEHEITSSRYHVRLWNIPAPGGPAGEVKTVGTPHHEDFIKHAGWGPISTPDHCNSIPFEVGGAKFSGNHAVDEGGVEQNKDSGFDQGRRKLREKFETMHTTEFEYWGNTNEYEQCDEDKAGSNGTGIIIWLRRALRGDTAGASSVQPGSAMLNGSIGTEEPTTEYWFGYGRYSSSGSGYPFKTPVKTISGSAQINPSEPISGLSPGTTYYVRLFLRNQDGEVEEANEIRFSSPPDVPESDDSAGPHPIVQNNGLNLGDPGTIDVFYRTPNGELGHNWQLGGVWGGGTLPGSVGSDPHAIVQNNNPNPGQANTIDVFYRTPNGKLGHNWQLGGVWGSGTLPGSVAGDPDAIVQNNGKNPGDPGTIDVFYRTPNGELGHNWQLGGVWGSGTLPGSVASDPHVVVQANANPGEAGTIDVFYRTPDGKLGHNWQLGGVWGHGTLPGSVAGDPHPIVQNNGKNPGDAGTIDVFYRTPNGELGHNWQLGGVWGSGTLPGPVVGDPHPIVQNNGKNPGDAGTIDVFYRTPDGKLGHNWQLGGVWGHGTLPGSVAARPPVAKTHAATDFYGTMAALRGTVNPESLFTEYHFEWASQAEFEASGYAHSTADRAVGSGTSDVEVSQSIEGLQAGSQYHFRVVAEGESGVIAKGKDETFETEGSDTAEQLAELPLTEPFDGGAESLARFGSEWAALGWAGGGTPKGSNTSTGWRAQNNYPYLNGAYRGATVSDAGWGLAAAATMAVNPASASRYLSLWLDMPTPAGAKAGYELRFTNTATDTYTVRLSKWVEGNETELTSKSGYSFADGDSLALVDTGATVSAWTDTGAGYAQLLSAADSSYAGGSAGLHASGNTTRLKDFKAGRFKLPRATTGAVSEVEEESATLSGAVNPRGVSAAYQIEYDTTPYEAGEGPHGIKVPASPEPVGAGEEDVAISEQTTGLNPDTIYHFRVVAISSAGTVYGEGEAFTTPGPIAGQLAELPLTEPFDGGAESLARFGSEWAALGWAGGGTPKGSNTSTGWRAQNNYPYLNGAYRGATVSDAGWGLAAAATMAVNPASASRYLSLWLDMPTPAGAKAGYELRFTNTATDTYTVRLSKWVEGNETELTSKSGYSFADGDSLALVDTGATVSAWTDTGAGYAQLLSAADSSYAGGSAGLHASGNTTRLKDFKAGAF
jgi:hypothetical protein